ncbi:alpha-L-rhamnosidase [Pelagicoccus mobilis]|uniref:alpha-L-rhamnosidase n=1 Tax=Pelagicoccus mobilis TaxID=415221 RepID=A0A934VQR7_9BACT|nr:alpha-L-rhamnosidase [Pelagicoccus mobilis]MBK1877190.1 family 78 glycoside hydrolase catalytic domain [Pelagicoccus mobilis]
MNTNSPVKLQANDLNNPEGISLDNPRLSWELDAKSGITETLAYRVEIADSEFDLLEGTDSVERTDWIENRGEQSFLWNDASPTPLKKLYWRVQVRDQDNKESEWSAPAQFRYGLASDGWKAKWIYAAWEGTLHEGAHVPAFRKAFDWNGEGGTAILNITALGAFHVEINGQTITDDEIGPGWTDYNAYVVYRTYDVSKFLKPGKNVIGVMLGDAWYCGHVGWGYRQAWGKAPQFMAQINRVSSESNDLIVTTGTDWKLGKSNIIASDLQMGEECDASLLPLNWSQVEGLNDDWEDAKIAPDYAGEVLPAFYPPPKSQETLYPQSTVGTLGAENRIIYNFGQNLVGRILVTLKGPAKAKLQVRYAERLDDKDEMYTTNLRTAKNLDVYHLRGGEEESWQTRFTVHGFQYVELTCESEEVEIFNIQADVLYNDLDLSGTFECSHPLLNKLHQNAKWGQKGNFVEIPTDCPQRNERLGWTGDILVYMETALYHGNSIAFFKKWLRDMRDSQSKDGAIPPFIPWVPLVEDNMRDGGPSWSDAHVSCAWTLYMHTGRQELLEQHYDSMVRYVDYLLEHQTVDYIRMPNTKSWQGFGDWLAQDGGVGLAGATPKDFVGTAFLANTLAEISKIADLLGYGTDAARFTAEREKTVEAFNRRFVTAEGLLASNTQTAYILALKFDLLSEKNRQIAAEELVRNIRDRDWHLTTGFVSTVHICDVVASAGYLEDAYKLLEQETYPSWLFPITNGATTIWERWDGWTPDKGFQDPDMNSFNHYALGAVVAWMFKTVVGIRPEEAGFRKTRFEPQLGGTLTNAKGKVPTPQGHVELAWQKTDAGLEINTIVPINTTAVLVVPNGYKADERELELTAGEYNFTFEAEAVPQREEALSAAK